MMSSGTNKDAEELKEIVEKFKQDNPEKSFFLNDEQIIQFITKPVIQKEKTNPIQNYVVIKGKTLKKGDKVRVKSASNESQQYLIGTIQTVKQRKISGSYYRGISTIYLQGIAGAFSRNDLEAIEIIDESIISSISIISSTIGPLGPVDMEIPTGSIIMTVDRAEFDYKDIEKNNIVIDGQEYYAIKGKTLTTGSMVIVKQDNIKKFKQFANRIFRINKKVSGYGSIKSYTISVDGYERYFNRSRLIAVEKVKEPLIKEKQPIPEIDLRVGDLVRISKPFLESQTMDVGRRQAVVKISGRGSGARFFLKDVSGWFSRDCLEKVVVIYTDKE